VNDNLNGIWIGVSGLRNILGYRFDRLALYSCRELQPGASYMCLTDQKLIETQGEHRMRRIEMATDDSLFNHNIAH
jgi:hypothetical protein